MTWGTHTIVALVNNVGVIVPHAIAPLMLGAPLHVGVFVCPTTPTIAHTAATSFVRVANPVSLLVAAWGSTDNAAGVGDFGYSGAHNDRIITTTPFSSE